MSLIAATRRPDDFSADLKKWIQIAGGQPALERWPSTAAHEPHAWLQGRDHVTPDDVRADRSRLPAAPAHFDLRGRRGRNLAGSCGC